MMGTIISITNCSTIYFATTLDAVFARDCADISSSIADTNIVYDILTGKRNTCEKIKVSLMIFYSSIL